MQGHIIAVNSYHGYGWLRPVGDQVDRFFHASALVGGQPIETFRPGDRVAFEAITTERGPAARAVQHALVEGTIVSVRHGGWQGAGFGFVRPDGGGEDRFFHIGYLAPAGLPAGELFAQLRVGGRVQYRESGGRPGERDRAIDVCPLTAAAAVA
jgi:cold shock CspA family protein